MPEDLRFAKGAVAHALPVRHQVKIKKKKGFFPGAVFARVGGGAHGATIAHGIAVCQWRT